MFRTKNFQLVEVLAPVTTSGNVQVMFPQQPQLQSYNDGSRRIFVKGIEVFSVRALAVSPYTAGTAVATGAAIANAVLTLNEMGTENKKFIPLTAINRMFAETGANFVPYQWQLFQFKGLWKIDWPKSYLTILAAQGTAFSYLFGVHYDDKPEPGEA